MVVNRVKLVKKELVERVEGFIEKQAKSGKLRQQIQEDELINLLNRIGSGSTGEKITVLRKRGGSDEDDDDDTDLM